MSETLNPVSKKFSETLKNTIIRDKRNTASSFMTYMGSKAKIANRLIPLFPEHKLYAEPFMGSAAIFFKKNKSEKSVLNDIDNNLVNLFKMVRDNVDYMINWCWWTPLSKKTFDDVKGVFDSNAWRNVHPLIRACGYLYLHQNSFNNKLNNKFYPGMRNKWNADSIVTKLFHASVALRETIIENRDAIELFDINHYNREDSFWYIDPPYYNENDESYYDINFKERDHWDLAQNIYKIKGKFMISYDNSSQIREYYKNFYITETKPIHYSGSFGETVVKKELVITNYDIKQYVNQTSLLEDEKIYI